MDAVMCASSQIRGRWDLCRCTLSPPPPPPHPFSASPYTHHHFPPPVTIPPSRWMGVSKISALSPCRGRTKSSSFLCLSKTWKHVSPIWWSCMILCVCVRVRFCGPGSPLTPVFHPGSAKSMAAELDKIRNGPNCACSAKVDQLRNIIENNRKKIRI